SAGWFYRVALENILGFQRRGTQLVIDPCIPVAWKNYEIAFRFGASIYTIKVNNPDGAEHGVRDVRLDGTLLNDKQIKLVDDGKPHEVQVLLGPAPEMGS